MVAHAKTSLAAGLAARQNVLLAYATDFLSLIPVWIHRHKSRNELAQLDMHMMDDIGISHSDMHRELAKPFWRA